MHDWLTLIKIVIDDLLTVKVETSNLNIYFNKRDDSFCSSFVESIGLFQAVARISF